jgi:hypothetical protein
MFTIFVILDDKMQLQMCCYFSFHLSCLVSRLSQQYEKVKAEKGGHESKIEVLNTTINGYKQELETSSAQWKKHVSVEEHLDTVNECRR